MHVDSLILPYILPQISFSDTHRQPLLWWFRVFLGPLALFWISCRGGKGGGDSFALVLEGNDKVFLYPFDYFDLRQIPNISLRIPCLFFNLNFKLRTYAFRGFQSQRRNSWTWIRQKARDFYSMLFIFSLLVDFYRKPYSTLLYTEESTKQKNSSLFMNSILLNRKMRVENQTKTRVSEKTQVYAQWPQLKLPFKNSISGLFLLVLQSFGSAQKKENTVWEKLSWALKLDILDVGGGGGVEEIPGETWFCNPIRAQAALKSHWLRANRNSKYSSVKVKSY